MREVQYGRGRRRERAWCFSRMTERRSGRSRTCYCASSCFLMGVPRRRSRSSSRGEWRQARWISSSVDRRGGAGVSLRQGSRPVRSNSRRDGSAALAGISSRSRSSDRKEEAEGVSCSLFIDNLSREVDVRALRWLLRMEVDIVDVFISRKRRPNNPLAFALVKFKFASQVEDAVRRIHGHSFLGQTIFAQRAKYPPVSGDRRRRRPEVPLHSASKLERRKVGEQGIASPPGGVGAAVTQESVRRRDISSEFEVVVEGDGANIEISRVEDAEGDNQSSRVRITIRIREEGGKLLLEDGGGMDLLQQVGTDRKVGVGSEVQKEVGVLSGVNAQGGGSNFKFEKLSTGRAHDYVGNNSWTWTPYWWSAWGQPGYFSWAGQCSQAAPGSLGTGSFFDWGATMFPQSGQTMAVVGGQDPIAEEIVRIDRVGSLGDRDWGGKIGTLEEPVTGEGSIDATVDVGLSQPELDLPQGEQVELGEDGEDLRALFEDPEYPPGFEPGGGVPGIEVDPDEANVKEEARQTLKLMKRLGCCVPDEGRTLGNYEDIIREQRDCYRQRCQEAKRGPGPLLALSL